MRDRELNRVLAMKVIRAPLMRKPVAGGKLVADVTFHKVGRVLAVGDVAVRNDGVEALVARATFTYSIPPKRDA